MKDTKHDKTKTYDKMIAMMLETCFSNIEEKTIDKVLTPENYRGFEESYIPLVAFNKNIFQIIGPEVKYEGLEKDILADIQQIKLKPGLNVDVILKPYDYLEDKFGRYKPMIIGMIVGFSIIIVFKIVQKTILKK